MELGIGMFGDLQVNAKGEIQPTKQRLQEIIEEIKLMDEVGLDFYGIGEHHRPDYAVSSPEIILAAAATVTKNIKLSSAVSVLSSSDPVKLYQSFATVDLISNGRAELMAGRGSFIESFPLFGYNLQDYDELYEEKLELLLKINKEPKITWKGKFRPELVNQEVLPRAVNDNLKIWVAVGGTPESVERAGRLGLPVMFAIIGGQPIQFKPLFDYYKKVYQA
jgi:alkanesulfonate monooxygenase SsuD/methylene tetrahydromethanopterin reductase-like flavin-dependent oxidoreductase (luciferase family)